MPTHTPAPPAAHRVEPPLAPGQTTVSEVNEIFIDLGRLVAGQTEQINTISSAIENTARRRHPTATSPCIASPPASHAHAAAARARLAAGGADRAREGGAAAREPLQVAPALEDLLPHARLDHRESRPPRARRAPAPQARPQPPACASRVSGGATAHHAHECTLVSEARGGCDAAPRQCSTPRCKTEAL